jgi:hypothetical protein
MKSPADRARTCVPCHVGGPGHDVDHDLIAAGHPRLNFEYTSHLEAMPKHWTEASSPKQPASIDPDVRAWVHGQLIAAQASASLLADRALGTMVQDPNQRHARPWPEFAEYDCGSCHHDLSEPSWSSRGGAGTALGSLTWNGWYLPLATAIAEQGGVIKLSAPGSPLNELRRLMAMPEPDPRSVERLAGAVAEELAGLVANDRAGTADELGRVLRSAAINPPQGTGRNRLQQLATGMQVFARARERAGRPLDPMLLAKFRELYGRVETPGQESGAPREWNALIARMLERADVPDVTPEIQSPK